MKAHQPYLVINFIKESKEEGVKISQEEGENSPQLPLKGNTGMIIFQLCNGFKQWRTH